MRAGRVAIVGRTNVGKSTFLNAALGQPLAITSSVPQTTRDELLGVVRREDSEIAFVDTPGLHRPKSELGRRMNATALGSLKDNDAVLLMTEVSGLSRMPKRSFLPEADVLDPDDRRLIQVLPAEVPCVLVLNKVDLLRDKARLLPLMQEYARLHEFASIIPVSVLRGDGVEQVLNELAQVLPEAPAQFGEDDITDRPLTFFVREYFREQVLQQTQGEIPHAVAVTVDRFEQKAKLCVISATVHVERDGQGSILVGKGGQTIKSIGTQARLRLEELMGGKVHLELFVRVSDRWKNAPRRLNELGYDEARGRSLENLLPARAKRRGPKPGSAAKAGAAKSGAQKGRSAQGQKARKGPKPNLAKAKSGSAHGQKGASGKAGRASQGARAGRPRKNSPKRKG